jgi:uncharacterized repeat protein (TIGR03803 family)
MSCYSRLASFGCFPAVALVFAASLNCAASAKAIAAAPIAAAQIQNAGDMRAQGIDLGRVAPSLPMDHLQLVLQRSPRQQQALNLLLDRQKRQGDPLFQQWLTPAEFEQTFGPTDTTIANIKQWLAARGFQSTRVAMGELAIDFSGTAAQVEQAFHVEIHNYRLPDGTTHYANAGRPVVPRELRGKILGVTGLNNRNLLAGDCSAVPDAVKQALDRNRRQNEQAQGYVGADPNTPLCGQTQNAAPQQAQPETTSFTESTVVNFTGATGTDVGAEPLYGNLIQASDGNFYGITDGGGTNSLGTVFQLTPAGTYTVLHSFSTATTDGQYPYAGLVQGTDGNFYGTTEAGGANSDGGVFQITSSGVFTLLYSFTNGADGGSPEDSLVQGTDGEFYGTTVAGGGNGNGTVFKITSGGSLTPLHSFGPMFGSDGYHAIGGLVQGTDGNYYGTAIYGGTGGGGTLYKISPSGAYSTFYNFPYMPANGVNYPDGASPYGQLVQGTDGNFYGTTYYGGETQEDGNGAIYKITPSASLTVIHTFLGYSTDGLEPTAGLVLGSDGNLYGTSLKGGTGSGLGDGTAYQISTTGTFNLLYTFGASDTDGASPDGGLVQGMDGNLYGTATNGGTGASGTIYKLTASPALAAPVVLSASPSTVTVGQPFTLSYSVSNADVGAENGTMNQCFATNTAGDTTDWTGIFTGTPTTQTQMLTATAGGAQTYSLTCGGVETGLVTVTGIAIAPTDSLSAVSAPFGSTTGVTITATSNAVGSVVTFGDSSGGGSFSQATCTISGTTCSVNYIPSGTLAAGTYAGDLTASFAAAGEYSSGSASSTLTITTVAPTDSLSAVSAPFGSTTGVTITATSNAVGSVVTFGDSSGGGTFSSATCTISGTTCSVNYIPSGTLAAGTYAGDLTASFAATTNYASGSASSTLTITAIAPTDSLSAVTAPYGSTTGVTITATSNAVGSLVTFGDSSGGGSFSPATCTISGTTCSVNYIPSGTLAAGTYAGDLTASFAATTNYTSGSASSTLTITAIAPSDSISKLSAPFGSTTGVTITATSNAVGSVVTFGDTSGGGSFSQATCTISGTTCSVNYIPSGTLAAGNYPGDLTASFAATTNYTSGSVTSTLVITKTTPALTLSTSNNSVAVNTSVTFTAFVTPNSGIVPSGEVSFTATVNGMTNPIAGCTSVSLVSGPSSLTATCTTSALTAGSYTITANLASDSNFNATSNTVGQIVTTATPMLALSTSNNSVPVNTSVTFTAAVTPNTGIVPTGAVSFSAALNGMTNPIAGCTSVPLVTGQSGLTATCTTSALTVGSYTITAMLAADSNFNTTSNTVGQTITALTPTITFNIPNHTYGDGPFTVAATSDSNGTFTYSLVGGNATVSTAGLVTITGAGAVVVQASEAANGNYAAATQNASFTVASATPTILFAIANHTYGDAPFMVAATSNSTGAFTYSLVSGNAMVTSGGLVTITGAGPVVVQASEVADANYASGTQNASFLVGSLATSTSVAILTNPLTAGQSDTVTITVTAATSNPISGMVTLQCGAANFGSAAVTQGMATYHPSTVNLPAGSYVCTARFSDPSLDFGPSAGSAPVTLLRQSSQTALTVDPASPTVGENAVLTATVTGENFPVTGGHVTFQSGHDVLGSAPVINGSAMLTAPTAGYKPGTYPVTATYSGDGSTAGSNDSISVTLQ